MLWRCTCNYSLSFHCLVEFDFAFACIDFKIGECVSKIHHFVSKSRPSRHLLFRAWKSKDVPDQSRKYNFGGGLRRSDWPRRIMLYCPVLAGLPERKLVTKIWSAMQFRAEKRSAQASAHPLSQAQGGLFLCVDWVCLLFVAGVEWNARGANVCSL